MTGIVDKLNDELLRQNFDEENKEPGDFVSYYEAIAKMYADVEGAISVLSDMNSDKSIVFYGSFARELGLSNLNKQESVDSIWEDEILKRIHTDDLNDKYLFELRFFHFIKQYPWRKRKYYYLSEKLRMMSSTGNFLFVHHRMFYFHSPVNHSVRFALCLYTPLVYNIPDGACIVNSVTGTTSILDNSQDNGILSEREKDVLRLIGQGMISKHIARKLFISINTVSRHRQNILEKLQVKNSIEACRIAKELGII